MFFFVVSSSLWIFFFESLSTVGNMLLTWCQNSGNGSTVFTAKKKSTPNNLIFFRCLQVSLKGLAELAAVQCSLMPLREFVDCSCGQFALLGLQFSWTTQARKRNLRHTVKLPIICFECRLSYVRCKHLHLNVTGLSGQYCLSWCVRFIKKKAEIKQP